MPLTSSPSKLVVPLQTIVIVIVDDDIDVVVAEVISGLLKPYVKVEDGLNCQPAGTLSVSVLVPAEKSPVLFSSMKKSVSAVYAGALPPTAVFGQMPVPLKAENTVTCAKPVWLRQVSKVAANKVFMVFLPLRLRAAMAIKDCKESFFMRSVLNIKVITPNL